MEAQYLFPQTLINGCRIVNMPSTPFGKPKYETEQTDFFQNKSLLELFWRLRLTIQLKYNICLTVNAPS